MNTGSLIIKADQLAPLDAAVEAALATYRPAYEAFVATITTSNAEEEALKATLAADIEAAMLTNLAVRAFERVCLHDLDHAGASLQVLIATLRLQARFAADHPRDTTGSIILTG